MFDCIVCLYAFNFDTHHNCIRLISQNPDYLEPISIRLEPHHKHIEEPIKELISDHLICSMISIKPRLFDVELVDNTIKINFVTSTPIDLKLADSYYIEIDNSSMCLNRTIQKALMYV